MEKNKIIAISGEPVTGKGTNVNALIENSMNKGITKKISMLFQQGMNLEIILIL